MQPATEYPMPTRRRWDRYLYIVGLTLLVALVWHFGWRELLETVAAARPAPLLGMMALLLTGFWIRAWKWRYALGKGQNAVGLFFLAKVAGNLSPGRIGELTPLLLRRHRNARVAAWIILDRIIEVACTLALGLLGVAVLGLLGWTAIAFLTGIGLLAGVVGLYVVYRNNVRQGAPAQVRPDSWRQRALDVIAQLRCETRILGTGLPLILLITLAGKTLDIYAVILLCKAFGYSPSFLLVCAARCAHALISGIPVTPDATGVPFVAAAYFLHEFAGIPYATLTAALALEVLVINALLWLSFLAAARDLRAADNTPKT